MSTPLFIFTDVITVGKNESEKKVPLPCQGSGAWELNGVSQIFGEKYTHKLFASDQ